MRSRQPVQVWPSSDSTALTSAAIRSGASTMARLRCADGSKARMRVLAVGQAGR